jgi:hypothetical protein
MANLLKVAGIGGLPVIEVLVTFASISFAVKGSILNTLVTRM